MRSFARLLVLYLTFVIQDVLGQELSTKQELYNPFSILIIKPDSATIPDSLRVWGDSIENKFVSRHYYAVRMLESMKEWSGEEEKKEWDQRIKAKKLQEMDAYNFKYYHTLANSTLFELNVLFNTQYWEKDFLSKLPNIIVGHLIERGELFSYDLSKIGHYYEVDYVVLFEHIQVDHRNGMGVLLYFTTLFSTKEDKILFKKRIEGNAQVLNHKSLAQISSQKSIQEKAEEAAVHCDNYLECMFTSAARFSTEELFMEIAKHQKK